MDVETGSKTIDRVGDILRALEHGPQEGMTSSEIALATHFDKATAYRALVSLTRIGLVDRHAESRRFKLGIYLFSLGATAAKRFSVLAHAREFVAELARETGDTVFLTVRNRYDAVCIDIGTGSYPIRAHSITVGDSLPLGVSTGGVATLAVMSDQDVRHALQFNAVAISKLNSLRPNEIYEHVQIARQRGYAHYAGHMIAGLAGVARAIRGPKGDSIAAVSVTALIDRMSETRVRMIDTLLKEGIEKIEQRALLIGGGLQQA